MSTIPYLSQGIGVPIDPLTGMPTKKKPPYSFGSGNQPDPWQVAGGFAPAEGGGRNTAAVPGGGGFGGGGSGGRPGSITLAGFTPDYKALIQQALGPLSAQLGAEGVADADSRDNQLIRTLGQFGEQFDSAGAQAAFGQDFYQQAGLESLLPRANQLAQQTTDAGMSFKARSKLAQDKAVQQVQDALAARGLLRSGATGIALQDQQRQYDTSQYDARAQMQDFLSSITQGFLQTQRQRQAQLDAAAREEAPRQAALNPTVGSQTAPFDPAAGAYRAPSGGLFSQDGTPYTPQEEAPQAAFAPSTRAISTPAVRGIGNRWYQAM